MCVCYIGELKQILVFNVSILLDLTTLYRFMHNTNIIHCWHILTPLHTAPQTLWLNFRIITSLIELIYYFVYNMYNIIMNFHISKSTHFYSSCTLHHTLWVLPSTPCLYNNVLFCFVFNFAFMQKESKFLVWIWNLHFLTVISCYTVMYACVYHCVINMSREVCVT